ncbi:hypothetical protein [Acinetobacter sp. YH1901134]|uniref:hypothetical protein n=1 Tax=Acinetobacter sp. YH1901134 TaxID=2601199 RepID=UPI0015D17DF5|nr:hypothetical protein [Acinetobacter sp. YH1901134]
MNKNFELHVLSQIYDFLIERTEHSQQGLHNKVLEFFKELNLGNDNDFEIVDPKKIAGKFGAVSFIHLINVPNFHDKDKFLKWAYTQLNFILISFKDIF